MNNFEQGGPQEIDVTLGSFHFSREEKDVMRAKGMTDEEIEKKEHEASNLIARKQVENERRGINSF